jgi:uncharacterized membrane protein YfcA
MHVDLSIAAAGLGVGFLVGLTGMGGGALMTPLLVLLFRIDVLAAVSSDLVAALLMKPVGGVVHARRGTVHRGLVVWLVAGSVPTAFMGSLLLREFGSAAVLQQRIRGVLGAALLVTAATIPARALLTHRRGTLPGSIHELTVKRAPTFAVGALGGVVVGLSSVGSGSVMLVLLLALYPSLTARELVGTDLIQAIPLVASAAIGHLLFGHVSLGITGSLVLGALPGVYVGARCSAVAPDAPIRAALVVVLAASGLQLLGAPTAVTLTASGVLTGTAGARSVWQHRRGHRHSALIKNVAALSK